MDLVFVLVGSEQGIFEGATKFIPFFFFKLL